MDVHQPKKQVKDYKEFQNLFLRKHNLELKEKKAEKKFTFPHKDLFFFFIILISLNKPRFLFFNFLSKRKKYKILPKKTTPREQVSYHIKVISVGLSFSIMIKLNNVLLHHHF